MDICSTTVKSDIKVKCLLNELRWYFLSDVLRETLVEDDMQSRAGISFHFDTHIFTVSVDCDLTDSETGDSSLHENSLTSIWLTYKWNFCLSSLMSSGSIM